MQLLMAATMGLGIGNLLEIGLKINTWRNKIQKYLFYKQIFLSEVYSVLDSN